MRIGFLGWLAVGAGLGLGGQAAAQEVGTKAFGDTVVCESRGQDRNFCRADTRGGVVLRRQLSQTRCDQGRTWDYDERGIWVSGGCRAEFMLGDPGHGRPPRPDPPGPPGGGWRPPHGGGELIVCESVRDRRQFCPADTRGGVQLIRRLSNASCLERLSWGWTREGIWVDRGCRAEFEVARYHQPQGRVVVCESIRDAYHRCGIGRARNVQLVRQLSDSPCRQNVSWGWTRNEIWVNRGCRAEFSVY